MASRVMMPKKSSAYSGKQTSRKDGPSLDEILSQVKSDPNAIVDTTGLTVDQKKKVSDAQDLALRRSWKPSPPSSSTQPFKILNDAALRQAFIMCAQYCGQEELKIRYGWMPRYQEVWEAVFGGDGKAIS